MPTDPFKRGRTCFFLGGILLILIAAGCSLTPVATEPAAGGDVQSGDPLEPAPGLSPDQVVRIQIEALQNNNEADEGIEITFRFASPGNKRFTGPLSRFTQMIKNPLYRPMLNHRSARYGPLEIVGNEATQRVTLIDAEGKAINYVFTLSKQAGPPCSGCWMTDSVTVEPVRQEDHQQS